MTLTRCTLTEPERLTLEQMASHHLDADARSRAQAIVFLARGMSIREVAGRLKVSIPSAYNWLDAWNRAGVCGLFSNYRRGSLSLLPDSMLGTAIQLAKAESLTLREVVQRLQVIYNEPLPCSLQTLRMGLRREGVLLKDNRYRRTEGAPKRIPNT